MRRLLDGLYRVSAGLAALFVVAICAVVLLQVGCNVVDALAALLRLRPIGLVVPAYAELTGFFLAAASFLALAPTLRAGEHVRVRLALHGAPGWLGAALELWSLAVAAATAGYFTWHATGLAAQSAAFGDVASGLVAVPLWLPQAAMAFGLLVLTFALLDALVERLLALRAGESAPVAAGQAGGL